MSYMTVPEYLPYWQTHFTDNKNGAYMVGVLQSIIDSGFESLDDVIGHFREEMHNSSTIVDQGYWWSALGYLQMIDNSYKQEKTPQELDWV